MTDTKISDEAVERATGRDWGGWFRVLDGWGAADKGHQATALHLAEEHGTEYALADGTTGEVRVVREGSHVRLTWRPPEWEAPSTLQVRAQESGSGRGTIGFHHEGLPDQESRAAMRAHWRGVLDRLGALGPEGG